MIAATPTASSATTSGPGAQASVSGSVSLGDTPARHRCPASAVENPVTGPHPLYRRPQMAGQGRTALMVEGWTPWLVDPPSEAA